MAAARTRGVLGNPGSTLPARPTIIIVSARLRPIHWSTLIVKASSPWLFYQGWARLSAQRPLRGNPSEAAPHSASLLRYGGAGNLAARRATFVGAQYSLWPRSASRSGACHTFRP